jgi:hypothetical protein
MLWIGGAQGAGKSTLAWVLAHEHDLPLHPVDLWAYDHQARMPAAESLDEQLARGAEAAADAFQAVSSARLRLVIADVRARGLSAVAAVVEGPQLIPALAAPVPHGSAVWLIPDPARTRQTRQQRLAAETTLAGRPVASQTRIEALLERDAILAARFRAAAQRSGRAIIEVPAAPDWSAIAAAVRTALGPGLRNSPRLTPGEDLSQQRRQENAAAVRQGRLWMHDAGMATMPSYRFACECGRSGCQQTWLATPDSYQARTAARRPLVTHHEQ